MTNWRPQLTATAWRIGKQNLHFLLVGVYIAWFSTTLVIYSLSNHPFLAVLVVTFFMLLGLSLIWFFANWLHGLVNRGRLILDCCSSPIQNRLLVQSGFWFILCIYIARAITSEPEHLVAQIFGIALPTYLLILAKGRIQVREHGVWRVADLLQWDQIDSCSLSEDSTLLIQTKRKFDFATSAIPIPPHLSRMVIEIVSEKVENIKRYKPNIP
jgi:hypothetical protein